MSGRALLLSHMGNAELDVWMGPEEEVEIARGRCAEVQERRGMKMYTPPPLGSPPLREGCA